MMEVTPHLKTVLKNYQHSATKSLQGPGLSLPVKNESVSPELKEEEEFVPALLPVQQVPILTTPDTSCSERTDTQLEGETISCFDVGGEKRLCLPQVLNSVLRGFSLQQINQECDQLQIYCSRCTLEQLNVLKNQAILPSSAPSCGLITKTDAERLCSALLHKHGGQAAQIKADSLCFPLRHDCFGQAAGKCFPEVYLSKNAKCIECDDCKGWFAPQQFVCHVHDNPENRTVHWGFDSSKWRCYLRLPDNISDTDQYVKLLDDMFERFVGRRCFPSPPPPPPETIRRKQVPNLEAVKERGLPLKKQKLDDLLTTLQMPPYITANPACIPTILEPIYFTHGMDFNHLDRLNRSAFKPFQQSIKESKLRHAALGKFADPPPVLQNPEQVVHLADSNRFEKSFQPNVALAPTPKKHRYGRGFENSSKPIIVKNKEELEKLSDTTISVVQPLPNLKYNPEIELSTDTEDSASESSEKSFEMKVEDALRNVEPITRDKILEIYKNVLGENERLMEEIRAKDNKISDLQLKNSELMKELDDLKANSEEVKEEDKTVSVICAGEKEQQ